MVFKNIKIQNFFSFGPDMQKLDLSQPGMYLITGHNHVTGSSNGAGKCVAAGTKIITKELGEINIDSLVDNPEEGNFYIPEELHVMTDEGWKKVECFWKTELQQLYELETESGHKLIASEDHRVMTQRGWIKLKNLEENDEIVVNKELTTSKIKSIKKLNRIENCYDIQVIDNKRYFSNGILSHNSTIFDAISYALFGQVTKKVNIPQIVNEQIDQDCMVELEFEADGVNYIVERWKKQKKHYDKLLLYKDNKEEENLISDSNKGDTQLKINEIIKFNYKSFVNAVMMTQEQISGFLQADSNKKKEIIENILQLNILTKYHWVAQQKRKILRKQYEQVKLKEESVDQLVENTKLAMQEYVNSCNNKKTKSKLEIEALQDNLNRINQTNIDAERKKIAAVARLVKKREDMMVSYRHEADKVESLKNEKSTIESTQSEYAGLIKNAEKSISILDKELVREEKEYERVSKELEHAHENPDSCPICENKINEDKFKNWKAAQTELAERVEETIKGKKIQIADNKKNLDSWNLKKTELQKSIDKLNLKIDAQRTVASGIKKDYEAIEIDETMDEEELNRLDEKKTELEQQIREKEAQDFVDKKYLESLMNQAKQYSKDKKEYSKELKTLKQTFIITKWWEDSLSSKKNSMKSWCINNITGYFNSKIKYYLDRFFEGSVSLQLDNDLNEVIHSNGKERIYDMFSGGEKRRLNLAILFALNDLVKTNVSSKMNIMFLDEVLSNYLDDKGISSVLEVLQDMIDRGNNSIFVIDHKDNFKDYPSFKNIAIVKESDGFSRIAQEKEHET